jgi:hypothetical protein
MKHPLLFFWLIAVAHADPVLFHPEGWTLGVEFPNAPARNDKTVSTKRGDQVWTRAECKGETEILALERTLQPDAVRAEKLDLAYEHGKASLLNFLSGSLKSEEKIVIAGREGRRWIIEHQKKSRVLEFRVVSIGREFYVFTRERTIDDPAPSTSDTFFCTIREKL